MCLYVRVASEGGKICVSSKRGRSAHEQAFGADMCALNNVG